MKEFDSVEKIENVFLFLMKKKPEMVVDEMLAICSDIGRWKEKKESEAANANYNEYLESKRYEQTNTNKSR